MSDRKNIALYRDTEGSSALHDALESRQYTIALNLIQKYPSLVQVKDIVSQLNNRRTLSSLIDIRMCF